MKIIVSKDGKNPKPVSSTEFQDEDAVQQYISNNPEAVAMYNIAEDIKLLILAREFVTSSGPIDAIGIDRTGNLYIVETKLHKNPDKRNVMAQILDYGAALWKSSADYDSFQQSLDLAVQKKFNLSLIEKLQDFYGADEEEVLRILEAVRSNLANGSYKFVILMDRLHKPFRNLISYINRNSKFDVYAVELEKYEYEDYEIVIPRLHGVNEKKDVPTGNVSAKRGKWDESSFLESVRLKLAPADSKIIQDMYSFAKGNGHVTFGTGNARASAKAFIGPDQKYATFIIFDDGEFGANFSWFPDTEFGQKYGQKMIDIGLDIDPVKLTAGNWATPLEKWRGKASNIQRVIREVTS